MPGCRSSASPKRCKVLSRPTRNVCPTGSRSSIEAIAKTPSLARATEGPVEKREAFLSHLVDQLPQLLHLAFRSEFETDEGPRPRADAMIEVVGCDHQVMAFVVAAANDDVRVRMSGIEMVDGDPIEMAFQIILHLRQQTADERFEILQVRAILGRHHQSKLMAIAS